jgi:hypothetical protein
VFAALLHEDARSRDGTPGDTTVACPVNVDQRIAVCGRELISPCRDARHGVHDVWDLQREPTELVAVPVASFRLDTSGGCNGLLTVSRPSRRGKTMDRETDDHDQ